MEDTSLARTLFVYDPTSGQLRFKYRAADHFKSVVSWKKWNTRFAGKEVGYVGPRGYRAVYFKGKIVKAHRLIWLHVYGRWPLGDIDHINGDRSDNRIDNLRDVSRKDNARNRARNCNNSSGVTGVHLNQYGKWAAYITAGHRVKHLGEFTTLEEATMVRKLAEQREGYHQNHGRVA